MKNSGEAIYFYCLARAESLSIPDTTGIDERHPPQLHRMGDIVAIWSKIFVEDFSGENADLKLANISWVGPRIRRHEKVVEQTMSHSPVLPTRFGTIFLSLTSLEQFVEKHHQKIVPFLDQVTDMEEWSVKGYLDRKRAKDKLLALELTQQQESLSQLSPGKRYFELQRIQASVDGKFNLWLKELCQGVVQALNNCGGDCAERSILSRDATGKEIDMILNLAFLVPRENVAIFDRVIEKANIEHDCHGLLFTQSGPWPPYSFCPTLSRD